MNIVVQDELVNGLDTGENSCLEVTNFTHRGIERKDNASAVGECLLSSDGWHCRCFLNCELNFVGWFWRRGGGDNHELGDNYSYYATLNVYLSTKFCNYPNYPGWLFIGPICLKCVRS